MKTSAPFWIIDGFVRRGVFLFVFLFLHLLLMIGGSGVQAHVGTPFVVLEGRAGQIPVRVVIREPEVVPGLAEIHVRVLSGAAERITVLPLHSSVDRMGAPRPDVALPVSGDPGLYRAELWLMTSGAYGVEVAVEGARGGRLMVPVTSTASVPRPMAPAMAVFLGVMGVVLLVGWVGLITAALREGMLPAEGVVSKRWMVPVLGGVLALLVGVGAVYGGARWWEYEAADQGRHDLLERHVFETGIANLDGVPVWYLQFGKNDRSGRGIELLPDHGKPMHVFLIEMLQDGVVESVEGGGERGPHFVHLHPLAVGDGRYECRIPELRSGTYKMFADITRDSGLKLTLSDEIEIPSGVGAEWVRTDRDDSRWVPREGEGVGTRVGLVGDGWEMRLEEPGEIRAGEVVSMRFRVLNSEGEGAVLEPYMRMLGHAIMMRSDGGVFTHVHPSGTLSMAAARRFSERVDGLEQALVMDAICGDLEAVGPSTAEALLRGGEVSFPMLFPEVGTYWVWVQVRSEGEVRTGCFRVMVGTSRGLLRGGK